MKTSDLEINPLLPADKKEKGSISLSEDVRVTNEQLIKAYSDLEIFFENVEEVLFSIDMVNFKVIQMSAACKKIYGYSPGEFIADIKLWIKLIHPEDKNVIEGNDEKLAAGKTVINQYRIVHKNGSIRWIEGKLIPTLDKKGLLTRIDGIGKDITENKLAEKSLQRSEANLRTILDNTDAGYLLIDVDLKIISFNERARIFAERDLHQKPAEGDYIIDYFVPERKVAIKTMMEDALLGNNNSYELKYLQPDNSTIWYHIHLFGISNKDGDIFALSLSVNEITERKLAEDKLNRLNTALEKRAAELADSNDELERFAYVASHDLQEPVRMVSSFLGLLKNKYNHQLDKEARRYIDFAAGGAERMKSLISDLLEFSRITTVKKDHTLINLNELVNKTLHILRIQSEESQATITFTKLPELPGDESQLMQLFQNLIGNAIKYRGNSAPVITIGSVEKDHDWEFFINDNGIGIAPDHFDKIFVIFQRLHNRNEYSGTGMGLAICKKIVELHGGKIWVESSGETGSCFYFTIPKLNNI